AKLLLPLWRMEGTPRAVDLSGRQRLWPVWAGSDVAGSVALSQAHQHLFVYLSAARPRHRRHQPVRHALVLAAHRLPAAGALFVSIAYCRIRALRRRNPGGMVALSRATS